MDFVNGKDDIPYMTWKIKNVPNHRPDDVCCFFHVFYQAIQSWQNTSKKYTDYGNMSNDGRNMSLFTRIRDLKEPEKACAHGSELKIYVAAKKTDDGIITVEALYQSGS